MRKAGKEDQLAEEDKMNKYLMLLELLVQCNKMFLRIILTRVVKTSLEKLFHLLTAVFPEISDENNTPLRTKYVLVVVL